MRAITVNEKFTDESDPIKDMGIGAVEFNGNAKSYSIPELEELYKRVHDNKGKEGKNGRVILKNDTFFDELDWHSKIMINNQIVAALNYFRNKERRDVSRGLNLKEGDVIKVEIKGKWVYGFPIFMKKGNIVTDSNGRLKASTIRGTMRAHAASVIKCSEKEAKEFKKEYEIKKRKF